MKKMKKMKKFKIGDRVSYSNFFKEKERGVITKVGIWDIEIKPNSGSDLEYYSLSIPHECIDRFNLKKLRPKKKVFEVGDRVKDAVHGKGTVIDNKDNNGFMEGVNLVEFDSGFINRYYVIPSHLKKLRPKKSESWKKPPDLNALYDCLNLANAGEYSKEFILFSQIVEVMKENNHLKSFSEGLKLETDSLRKENEELNKENERLKDNLEDKDESLRHYRGSCHVYREQIKNIRSMLNE